MRAPRIYLPTPLATGITVPLSSNAFAHLIRALRLKPGEALTLFNGEGGEFSATLQEVGRKQANVTVDQYHPVDIESPLHTLLGQCISRGERMDYTIQKAVELGVSEIVPLFSERCEIKLKGERLEKKVKHWQQIVISACEQSGRTRIPTVQRPLTLQEWSRHLEDHLKLMLDPKEGVTLKKLAQPESPIALLIGPEGGLTLAEKQITKEVGFTQIQLGPRVLRTETAALATLSAIQTLWGDLST